MKKIILFAVIFLVSCSHDHSKDKVLGNIHDVFNKELKDSLKKFAVAMHNQRKKIIDSMRVSFKRAPEGTGWYSAKDMHLPPGKIMDFNPDDVDYSGPGPYLIIIKGSDGRQTINRIDKEKWLMFQRGDILK